MSCNDRSSSARNFLDELTSRIVKESGNQNDKYHIGKMIFQSLMDEKDFLLQIDAGTGKSETSGSVLERSIRCALAFQKNDLKTGDVIILMGPNNIHQCIPLYAALYVGVASYGIDRFSRLSELKNVFESVKPKIIFCVKEKAYEVKQALCEIKFESLVVTYDDGDNFKNFKDFLMKNSDEKTVETFRPADFDPDTNALLVATSGSTGLPKCTICKHKELTIGSMTWFPGLTFPEPSKTNLIVSPIQWLTALNAHITSPILRITRLQTSLETTRDHVYDMINTYKPTYTTLSPSFMTSLMNPAHRQNCDFSSFKLILIGGSAVPKRLIKELREYIPNSKAHTLYGISEIAGVCTEPVNPPLGSVGRPSKTLQLKLINVTTGEEVTEPNMSGEVWIKGPSLFKSYFNNDKATAEAFSEDGWFKTGDIFYRDENWNLFFVERLKLLLKFGNHQISPCEIEEVIRSHPGVFDAAVAGVPHDDDGELPVAFVVKQCGQEVGSDDIKKLVKDSLADSKQLRGGVVFIESIPLTATGKVDRQTIRQMAAQLKQVNGK